MSAANVSPVRGRVPPHNLEAEESLVGAMMLSREAVDAATEAGVTARDFYKPAHGYIYDAAYALHNRGESVDPVTVAEELRRQGQLDDLGGRQSLLRIQAATPASANAQQYARIVTELALLRRLIEGAGDIQELAYTADDPAEAVARIAALTDRIIDSADVDDTWTAIDLTAALTGIIERPQATVLRRDDNTGLFYAGRVNGIHGDSGLGKSMLLAYAAAQELEAGNHVGWIDFEDPDETVIVERLRMFDVDDFRIATQLHYHRPQSAFSATAVNMIARAAGDDAWTLLVIDSLGEAFGLEGINEDKDVEVGPWLRRVTRILADAGPAVVTVDHATKAADNALHPSGSKRKRAAITGASYLVEATSALTRDRGGKLKITCAKDRHGNYQRGREVASLSIEVGYDPATDTHIRTACRAPEKSEWIGPTHCIEAICTLLGEITPDWISTNQIGVALRERGQSFGNDTIRGALRIVVDEGRVDHQPGPRGSRKYRAKDPTNVSLALLPGNDTF